MKKPKKFERSKTTFTLFPQGVLLRFASCFASVAVPACLPWLPGKIHEKLNKMIFYNTQRKRSFFISRIHSASFHPASMKMVRSTLLCHHSRSARRATSAVQRKCAIQKYCSFICTTFVNVFAKWLSPTVSSIYRHQD